MDSAQKGLGWKRDVPDSRDKDFHQQFYQIIAPSGHGIAPEIDLRDRFRHIYDQGHIGSCTANAIAAMLRYGRLRALNQVDDKFDPSRLYIYYNERIMDEDSTDENWKIMHDSGAQIRNGIKSLHYYGACPENAWPYKDKPKADKKDLWPAGAAACSPPKGVLKKAEDWKKYLGVDFSYYRIADANSPDLKKSEKHDAPTLIQQLKRCLSAGYPFVFGFNVYGDDQMDEELGFDDKGNMKIPGPGVARTGGHAVVAVGYRNGSFLIRNSWGPAWGKRWAKAQNDPHLAGHFLMPEAWFEAPGHTDDFWVIEVKNVH